MTVLTAIDNEPGSEAVLSTGVELATGLDKDLVVLHVVPDEQDTDDAKRAVESIVETEVDDPDSVTIDIQRGNPASRILSTADDLTADYIVLGSRKESPVGKVVYGSTTQLVMLNSDIPVVNVTQIE